MLRIYLTGRVVIETEREVIEASVLPGRQGRLAFVYLVAAPRRVERPELADVLWPDELPDSWDGALSSIISKLRKVMDRVGVGGVDVFESVHGSYEFRPPESTWIDLRYAVNSLDRAEGALRRGQAKEAWADATVASAIFRRPFLPGESGQWVDQMRQNLHDYEVRTFDTLAGALLADGQAAAAVRAAKRAVQLAPFTESCHARLMECHLEAGNRAEAVRVYNDLTGLLRDSLGITPTTEVDDLYLRALQ